MTEYLYDYQGTSLRSSLRLQALQEVESSLGLGPELSIQDGRIADEQQLVVLKGGWLSSDLRFGFDLKDVGKFVISRGERIEVVNAPTASATLVEQVLLGTAFAVAMMQQQRFCLHGAVLSRNGRTIAFCGDSGEGKSTLAVALSLAGWQVLTDDLALMQSTTAGFVVMNNGRHVRLWVTH